MLKKIALLVLIVLPLGVFAQTLKFGHMNSSEIIPSMPEYTKAVSDLNALEKKYTDELTRTQEEFSKKYQEFQQAMADGTLPQNIAERRQKELQDMMQRQEQFQQEAQQGMQQAEQDLMMPIYQKLNSAIESVGAAKGMIYVFDLARTHLPYICSQSIDLNCQVKTLLVIK